MSVLISGALIDGAGIPMSGYHIILKSRVNTSEVVMCTVADVMTGNDGEYCFHARTGKYGVYLKQEWRNEYNVGEIAVYEGSAPGTLNDFLIAPDEGDLKPDVIKRFEKMVAEAQQSAEVAAESEQQAGQHAEAAVLIKKQVETLADDVQRNTNAVAENTQRVGQLASEVVDHAELVQQGAQDVTDAIKLAQRAAKDSASSAENSKNNADNAAISEQNALKHAQKAKDSEVAVAQSASEAENSAKRAEEGADRVVQSINDALLNTLAGPSLTPDKWNTWPQPALPVGGMTLAAVNIADTPWGQKVYRGSILPGGVLYATSLQVENRGMTLCCTGNNLTTLKGTYRLLGGSMRSGQYDNAANTWFICLVMRVL